MTLIGVSAIAAGAAASVGAAEKERRLISEREALRPGEAVEHPPQQEPAARCDLDARFLVISRPSLRQRLERRSFDLNTFAIARVAPSHHLINEAPVSGKVFELMCAAQQELVTQRMLEVTVCALDLAVLMRNTRVVARRGHAVVHTQFLVARREVLLCNSVEIAEGGRQTVAAVLLRHPAQRPKRILQAFRKRHKALPAQHHMGMPKPEKPNRK